jgi:hypothetical protein
VAAFLGLKGKQELQAKLARTVPVDDLPTEAASGAGVLGPLLFRTTCLLGHSLTGTRRTWLAGCSSRSSARRSKAG